MLEFEIAAIYYFVDKQIKVKPYFEEIPMDFMVPCVFYPTPNPEAFGFSTNAYGTEFVMYVKFMARSTMDAYENGEKVLQAIMKHRRKIPLVDEKGKETGKQFQINMPKLKKIESGVYQMEISWKRYSRYEENAAVMAREFFMNGLSLGKEDSYA